MDVNSAQIRGIGYIRLGDIVKRHPLYPQLQQVEAAIASIDLAAAVPHAPMTTAQISAATARLDIDLKQAQDRTNAILAQKQQQYADAERAVDVAALRAAGQNQAADAVGRQMSATSAQQAQAAASQASQDFAVYQQSVIAQNNAASAAIARQLQNKAAQQFQAKAEQLQQNETDLSLQLTQNDSAERLTIKTRLSNLALDDAARAQLEQQLAAIEKKETDAMNAQRAVDRQQLMDYQRELQAQTAAAIRTQIGAVQSRTQAAIAARRNEVGAEIGSLGPAPIGANVPADVRQKLAQIHQQFAQQFQGDAQKAVGDYNATKADLDNQYAALHGA